MSHKAILFSTRFIGKSNDKKVKYLFESPQPTYFESNDICNFFRTGEVFDFLFVNDLIVRKKLSERQNHFRKTVINAGFLWKQEFEDKSEKEIIGLLQDEKSENTILDELLDGIIAEDEEIENEFKNRFDANPSAIIKSVLELLGETVLSGLNIGRKDGCLNQRFQLYELKSNSEDFSVYAVWDLKSACTDGSWENALCKEILKRGDKNRSYSDIYLFLHDKDIFTEEKTFGVKEPRILTIDNHTFTLHVAYFKHEHPDHVKELLEKNGMPAELVAKNAIALMYLNDLKEILSALDGIPKWDTVARLAKKLPEEEIIRQLFVDGETYKGKDLSAIKKRVKTRRDQIQSLNEK